ncbi:ABC transporter ATP-binding protein [Vibrio algivorus]|uniref:ABC transporter ATP-binding protein n=1 Tax=Vibrio algivorus TaxID=1667024 RepID=A0A557PB03_9VIBR|nr:ABC transporter ATP-binding protein [Vibrio algivorus]TVO37837.1 ABC transporter ATP-binding protein [Vibrio algivorus]GLT16193.1 iron(III) ABC transporter ATP-binding protein [Vibrio algivorus]
MFKLNQVRVHRDNRDILSIDELSIPSDGLTVVLGHNGSGKSTLVNLLSGQAEADSGQVTLNETEISEFSQKQLAKEIAFLPQKLPDVAGLTVQELVRLGRFPWRGVFGRWQNDDEKIIIEAMQKTGVKQYANNLADKLSGGERQRAWVAMLLAQQSPVLILDEPTSALDIHHQYHLMDLLQELNQQSGCGILVILHDLNLALRYATHIVALKQGKIAFSGAKELLLDDQRLTDLYETDIQLLDHPQQDDQKIAVVI